MNKLSATATLSFLLLAQMAFSQPPNNHQFLAYKCIPAWVGVASNWDKTEAKLHFYPPSQYPGHADFVSKGLKTGINFSQFKQQVMHYQSRKYLPFFVYDLRQNPITLQGTTCHWVLHMEDYSYTDSPEEMAATVLRLLNTMSTELQKMGKGAVVLTSNTKGHPNIRMAAKLEEKGYYHVSTTQVIRHFGGAQTQVLNGGTAHGYLKYVAAGQENSYRPKSNEIVIYEQLPKRLFPVSGIISLVPQHELSHINLLAKNRGTVNISIQELDALPNASSLQGELVQLVCIRGKVILTRSTAQDAERFWASKKRTLHIPAAATDHKAISVLANREDPGNQLKYIGSKAYNYHWLLAHPSSGAVVKKGLAIPFSHYFHFMTANGLNDLVSDVVENQGQQGSEWAALQLKKLRKKIEDGKLPESLTADLKKACAQHMTVERIRLRSSTNCEDLPDFNGAGLYLSKGFDTTGGQQKLAKKIKEVYASLWSFEAFEERSYFGIDHKKVAMAILVSPAYQTEYANGVLMSLPNPSGVSFLANSQFASHSVSNPTGTAASELIVYNSDGKQLEVKSVSSIHPIFTDPQLETARTNLLKAAKTLHTKFTEGYPHHGIDIEYKVMYEEGKYTVYLKQIRLIGNVLPE